MRVFLLACIVVLLQGCAGFELNSTLAAPETQAEVQPTHPVETAESGQHTEPLPPADLWARIRNELTWSISNHPTIEAQRKHYLGQDALFEILSERASWYLFYIAEQVQQRNLPMELALLPIVESTLIPQSMSHRSAAGLWQIMPSTGKHLGLTQNWWYDGRLDIRSSTDAALSYLESLNNRFDGDWLLALSAYNAGAARVKRAQSANERKGLPTDYWSLKLPRETRHYLPRLLALAQIIKDPDYYGVHLPTVPNEPAFASVVLPGQVEVADVAKRFGMEEDVLRRFNPGILRWATDPNGLHELLVPLDRHEEAQATASNLPAGTTVEWHRYTIQPGDSIIKIAKRFQIDVGMLRAANDLQGSFIRAGAKLMIPVGGEPTLLANGDKVYRASVNYTVRPGDSLSRIASRFRISIRELVSWNELDPTDYLYPGQRLTLFPGKG